MFKTYEFDFYRCVNIEEWVYGPTVSQLHLGNLRYNDTKGRYSKIFPNEKISYWADSKATALAEITKHGGNKDYLTFHSYDDPSSAFPTIEELESLIIIDGRELGFHKILCKIEENNDLNEEEIELIKLIESESPDCLAYNSVAKEDGVNFLFFEKGFKKLSLREIQLYMGVRKSKNSTTIYCAVTSDYSPIIDSYGLYFEPIVRISKDESYKNTDEYKFRYENKSKSLQRMFNK